MSTNPPPNNGLKIKIGPVCIYVTRKMTMIIITLAVAGGGGSWAALGLATSGEIAAVTETNARYATASDTRHKAAEARLSSHDEQLKAITVKIGSIQEVQHWQVADQSAERVCQGTPIRVRQACYKRLFKWSLDRLRREKLPCTNLNCSD